MDEFRRQLLARLRSIEERLDTLAKSQSQLQEAYARSRAHRRRLWLRPPMWTFEQHPPRPLNLSSLPAPLSLPKEIPGIANVTPSFNQGPVLVRDHRQRARPKLFDAVLSRSGRGI